MVNKRNALNLVRTGAYRAGRTSIPLHDAEAFEPLSPGNQDDAVFLKEALAELEQLPDRAQRLIRGISIDGRSYEETALAEGVAIGTVKSALHRATDTLKQRLAHPGRSRRIAA